MSPPIHQVTRLATCRTGLGLPLPEDFKGVPGLSRRKDNRSLRKILIDALIKQEPIEGELGALVLPVPIWKELLEGSLALEFGEVPQIFSPAPTRRHGRPYTLFKLKMWALLHLYLLVGEGMKRHQAETEVATAFGISIEALRSWEKRAFKTHPYQIDFLRGLPSQSHSERTKALPSFFAGASDLVSCGRQYREALRARSKAAPR